MNRALKQRLKALDAKPEKDLCKDPFGLDEAATGRRPLDPTSKAPHDNLKSAAYSSTSGDDLFAPSISDAIGKPMCTNAHKRDCTLRANVPSRQSVSTALQGTEDFEWTNVKTQSATRKPVRLSRSVGDPIGDLRVMGKDIPEPTRQLARQALSALFPRDPMESDAAYHARKSNEPRYKTIWGRSKVNGCQDEQSSNSGAATPKRSTGSHQDTYLAHIRDCDFLFKWIPFDTALHKDLTAVDNRVLLAVLCRRGDMYHNDKIKQLFT